MTKETNKFLWLSTVVESILYIGTLFFLLTVHLTLKIVYSPAV